MASWSIQFGPDVKSTVNTAIGNATLAMCRGFDPGMPLATETLLDAHFAAAKTAAQGALASLAGPAPRALVMMQGVRDTASVAPWGSASSKIVITATEIW
jgi:hypothetical protein